MAAQNKTRPFGMRDYFGYAMGDFGCNMSFALITNYLMLFYTQYIGLRLSDWAWIIVVGKVWDAINDPLIGGMVDNVRIGKGSKFMPWITIGGSALIIFTTLSFMPIASMSSSRSSTALRFIASGRSLIQWQTCLTARSIRALPMTLRSARISLPSDQ